MIVYMSKKISEATSEELLHALIHVNGLMEAPRKRELFLPAHESLISIGDDATASILIFDEDIRVLNGIVLGAVTEAPETPEETIGDRIRDRRCLYKMTQEQLGQRALIAPAAISHYENDRREPSYKNIKKLARALGCTTDYLLGMDSA